MLHRSLGLSALLAAAVACGGGSSTTPSPGLLQVAGSYQITPTLGQNGCGSVTVQPGPAQVVHVAGAAELRLSHAGQTYPGRIETSGAFVTDPQVLALAPGSTDTVRIEGRFRADGFDANVTVDAAHAGAPACRYVVAWRAAKQGSPNVIP